MLCFVQSCDGYAAIVRTFFSIFVVWPEVEGAGKRETWWTLKFPNNPLASEVVGTSSVDLQKFDDGWKIVVMHMSFTEMQAVAAELSGYAGKFRCFLTRKERVDSLRVCFCGLVSPPNCEQFYCR